MKPFTRMFGRSRTPDKPDAVEPERPAAPLPPLFAGTDAGGPAPPDAATDAMVVAPPALPDPVPLSALDVPETPPAAAVEDREAAPEAARPAEAEPAAESSRGSPNGHTKDGPTEAAHEVPAPVVTQAGPVAAAAPVDWRVLEPAAKSGAGRKRAKRQGGGGRGRLPTTLADIAASSLAAGMMAAAGRRYGTEDALAVLDEVRVAMRPSRTGRAGS